MNEKTGSKRELESGKGKNIKKGEAAPPKKGRVIKLTEKIKNNQSQMTGVIPDEVVFAMDIGTRSVVGVVGVQEESFFRILATEITEHKNRAMLDGQIHDIEQVAYAAAEVKRKLETRLGFKLKKVAIAAAGRVLKTCQVRVEKNLEQGKEIDADLVSSLEIEGIQSAQMNLDEEMAGEDKNQFYCVGYSVINYYLNGFVISKLTGHRGKSIGADVLATFLPIIVVDSLYSVMNKIGLEVSSLTLEPIAAINVTIPPDLRLLNLALVDIGAGTSDIALTKDGSVIAYAMVPLAGDEITEKISQHYLVDFNTGEKIKIALSSSKNEIAFTDILKKKHTIPASEILKAIEDSVQLLASTIAQRILEYNHKAPNAIFMVGGGSRVPGLPELIAQQLGLAEERVVVRGRDVIRDIKFNDKKLFGPESITPYGIAVTAQMYSGKDFLSVTVNEKKIKLFNSKKLTVADALILYGFDAGHLIGRSGKGMTFSVNGEVRQARGEYGKSAELFVGGKPCSLDTPIAYGDNITVIPAQDGKDASVKALELVTGYSTGIVKLNGNPVDVSILIYINGRQADKDTAIKDGDAVLISQIRTLGDLLEAGGFESSTCEVVLNGDMDCSMEYVLKDKDSVVCTERKDKSMFSAEGCNANEMRINEGPDELSEEPAEESAREDIYLAPSEQKDSKYEFGSEDIAGSPSSQLNRPDESEQKNNFDVMITVNGKAIAMKGNRAQYIFVDIFNYIDFDLSKPQGTIVLKLNGQQAAFTDVIGSGDVIEIYWRR